MFDRILAAGSAFDWISPLYAYLLDATNGPSHTFLMPHDCGWAGIEIERLLREHEIRTWGLMIVKSTIMITVPLHQALMAQDILTKNAIPTEGPMVEASPGVRPQLRHRTTTNQRASNSNDPKKAHTQPFSTRTRKAQVTKSKGLIDALQDNLDAIAEKLRF